MYNKIYGDYKIDEKVPPEGIEGVKINISVEHVNSGMTLEEFADYVAHIYNKDGKISLLNVNAVVSFKK